MSRYDGKPFLRFLDGYVLQSIGELEPEQQEALRRAEPILAESLGHSGGWFDIVAIQMDFSADLPEKIRRIWEEGKARANSQGIHVDAKEFTRQFISTNFPDIMR